MENERPRPTEDEFCTGFCNGLGPFADGLRTADEFHLIFSSATVGVADTGGSPVWNVTLTSSTSVLPTSLDFDVHSSSSVTDDPSTDPTVPAVVVIVGIDEFHLVFG